MCCISILPTVIYPVSPLHRPSLMSVEVKELFYKDVSLCDQQHKGILVLGTKTNSSDCRIKPLTSGEFLQNFRCLQTTYWTVNDVISCMMQSLHLEDKGQGIHLSFQVETVSSTGTVLKKSLNKSILVFVSDLIILCSL